MKNSKSLLAILMLLIGVGTLSSCNKKKVTEQGGIEYTFIKEGKEKGKNGEFLLYNFEVTTENDSVIFTTTEEPFPATLQINDSMPVNNGMDEIFLNLRKGDSIALESTVKLVFGENYPPFLQPEDIVKVRIGAFEIMDEEAIQTYYEKVMAAEEGKRVERAKERLVEEAKIIQNYVDEKGFDAKKTDSGLFYVIEREGTGEPVTAGSTLKVDYAGYLLDGTLFDTSIEAIAKEKDVYNQGRDYAPFDLVVGVGEVIQGWDEGLMLLKKGSKAKLIIPSPLAYGERGGGALIPANSILVFDVEIHDVK